MSLSLSHCIVLVTRPQEQAEGLCLAISEAGGEALAFPTLAIEALTDPLAVGRITRIDDYDWAIFVSANAVRNAQKTAENGIIPPTTTVRVAAIGQATAEALRAAGVGTILTPPEPNDSEALAAMEELQEIAGRRVLIVRGVAGREWLAETLRQRGALVEYAEVYRRVKPNVDVSPLLDRWRKGQIHATVVTSGEVLSNLVAMIGFEGLALLRKTPLITISERVRQQALELGIQQVISATGASDAALVQALTQSWGPGIVTDQDNQPTPTETLKAESITVPVVEKPAPAPKGRRIWVVFTVIFIIALIAAGGYFLMQQIRSTQEGLGGELSKEDREIAELNTQVADLQGIFKTLHEQVVTLETRMATEDSKLERVLGEQNAHFTEKLERTQTAMQADLQGLHRILGKTRSDWLVADAEYLLGAALQRLHLVGDIKTAIAALEGADERLREAGEPAVFKVREQLANEIRILKSFTPPDLIGASSRLLALEGKVKELPLFLPHAGKTAGPAATPSVPTTHAPPAATPTKPGSALPIEAPLMDGVLNELQKYVSIRRLDKPISSVLTPEETMVLREILLLKLETARMALVRNDDALYKNSLETARAWLAENFDLEQTAVRSVDNDIKALMEQPIQVTYPELGKSLAMLRDITKLRVETDGASDKSHDKSDKKAVPTPTPEAAPVGQGAPKP